MSDIKTIYIDNQLENTPLTLLLTLIYVGAIIAILHFKHKIVYRNLAKCYWSIVGGIVIATWFIFNSLIFNTNELITRETGIQLPAKASYSTETKEVKRKGRDHTYTAFHSTFTTSVTDSIRYSIEANKTTFDPENKDLSVTKVTVCLDVENEKVALLIPWHTTSNICWIKIWSISLIFVLLCFWGCFNNFFRKIDHLFFDKTKSKH